MTRWLLFVSVIICNTSTQVESQIICDFIGLVEKNHFDYCLTKEYGAPLLQDSLKLGQLYYDLGKKSAVHSDDLSLLYNGQARKIFREIGHDSLYYMVTCSMSLAYISGGKYAEAEEHIKMGLAYWEKVNNNSWVSHTLSKKGFLEKSKGNLVKALDFYHRAHLIRLNDENLRVSGDIVNRLGGTYISLGDYESALRVYEEFLNEKDIKNPKGWEVTVMTNAAKCYKELGNDSLTRVYRNVVNRIWINSSSFKTRIHGYRSLAEVAHEDKDSTLAIAYIDSAYSHAKIFGMPKELGEVEVLYAKLLIAYGRYDEAKDILDSLLVHALLSNRKSLLQEAYEALSIYHLKMDDYEMAMHYDVLNDSLYQELYSDRVINEVKKIDIRIHTEEIKDQISYLEERNKIDQHSLFAQKKKGSFLITSIFIILGFLVFLGILYRQKIKTAVALREKNKAIDSDLKLSNMLIKEIHHRVKNNLQVVSSLLSLQSTNLAEKIDRQAFQTAKSRIHTMSLLHQKFYIKDHSGTIRIKDYFQEIILDVKEVYSIDQDVSIIYDIEDIILDVDKVLSLGLIVNELITNSFKHAFSDRKKGSIGLKIYAVGKYINVDYRDSGPGLPPDFISSSKDSIGRQLINSLARKLEADMEISSVEGCYIKFSFSEPSLYMRNSRMTV